ncbi:MAG: RAMP superfamily CRISPR-associated protein [Chloroflexota bacterium]
MTQYQIPITLTILGPFLTAATGPEAYGMDKAFHRDGKNNLVIPDRHIKGKLRMALEELSGVAIKGATIDLETWFGTLSEEESYEPVPGLFSFTQFRFTGTPQDAARTRTAINAQSGTAAAKQLRKVEDLFASGSETNWIGSVNFYATDEAEARQIRNALRIGFIWLTNLGAEKGVGFGRLSRVQVGEPVPILPIDFDLASLGESASLHLRIRPMGQIMIGGIKKPRTNFVRSERIIPGAAIKGALAASLNQAHGIRPYHLPLSAETAERMPGFAQLAENFDQIRVTHAFPAQAAQPRPVRIPLSTVKAGGDDFFDLALNENPSLLINDLAPAYFIDWKTPQEYIGVASPKEVFVTRTEIDDTTRRSKERNLFTYTFLCPEDIGGNPVEWICNVDFDNIENEGVRRQVRDQFAHAVLCYLDRLGKLNQAVTVAIQPDVAPSAEGSCGLFVDGEILLTLQTDTIMLNPEDVRGLSLGEDLFSLYANFWKSISDWEGSGPCLELVDYFAHQNFQGGYLYHRYLGAAERHQRPNNYYPYYLTGAGSVFRLRVKREEFARNCLRRWLRRGLELPDWAVRRYSQFGRAIWQNCPFVPENGYGEIAINLNWHWEKKVS